MDKTIEGRCYCPNFETKDGKKCSVCNGDCEYRMQEEKPKRKKK